MIMGFRFPAFGERLLLWLSWLGESVSTELSERKVVKVSSIFSLFVQSCRGKFLLSCSGFLFYIIIIFILLCW